MKSSNTEKLGIKQEGLRYKLLIIEALVFILPVFILFYIFYRSNIFLDFSQIFIVALTLVLILAGLIILRQIFDKFFLVATLMKKMEGADKGLIDMQQDTAELHGITVSFNNLMKKFEETTGELQQRVFELFSIKELTEVASKILDVDDLLNVLLTKAMAVSKAQIGSVFIVESEKERFRVAATMGLESGPKKGSYININESLARFAASDKKPLLVQDIDSDSRTHKANDPKYGPPSFLSMPVFVRGNVIAVLNLSHKETKQVFGSNDEHILSIIIGEIGFALENAMLHSRVEEHLKDLQERTVEMKASLKEKEVLLKEIHHRVKNNLQVISSLLDLSSMRTTDQETIDLCKEIRARIHTMALIHTFLYRGERFDRVDMGSYLKELVDYLSQTFGTKSTLVTPVIEPSEVYLSMTEAVPCALVLNEVISNAFRHAFKEGQKGTIKISLKGSPKDRILIRVKDDGIGMPEEIDLEKANSLGLRLVRAIVREQLMGEIRLNRDHGTEIFVEFSVLNKEDSNA